MGKWIDADDLPADYDTFDCPVRFIGGMAQFWIKPKEGQSDA